MSPSKSAATAGITITFPKVDQLPLAMSSARESILCVPSAITLSVTTFAIVNVTNWGWFLCFKVLLNALPPEKLTRCDLMFCKEGLQVFLVLEDDLIRKHALRRFRQ